MLARLPNNPEAEFTKMKRAETAAAVLLRAQRMNRSSGVRCPTRWNRCQTEVLKVSLYCCVKPASQRRTFAIICYKSSVDRCNGVQVAWCLDLHELAISCTSWHGPPFPGQIRIPSLAPSSPPRHRASKCDKPRHSQAVCGCSFPSPAAPACATFSPPRLKSVRGFVYGPAGEAAP